MSGERAKATAWGLTIAGALAVLIVLGSRNLAHFDLALSGYTFATLFAAFGITCRVALWLHRPPTALYARRGFGLLLRRGRRLRNAGVVLHRLVTEFFANRFIFRRGVLRGAAHLCIMWGCLTAFAVTFPLVFGWVHFETLPGDVTTYQAYAFGLPAGTFAIRSLAGFLVFHALVWSSLLVVAGVLLALRRRLRDQGVAALQQFAEDFLPLLLLFAISVTGLLLTVSYTWMKGYAYEFLALLHAVTVVFTLLYLPFGKLFHIFIRPVHLAVALYKDAGRQGEQAHCRRCDRAFASRMHVEDLIAVQRQVGFRYDLPARHKPDAQARDIPSLARRACDVGHYQWVCPSCRRALLGLAQGALWTTSREGDIPDEIPTVAANV